MKKSRFEQLLQSIKEAGEIMRGTRNASRIFLVTRKTRRRLWPDALRA